MSTQQGLSQIFTFGKGFTKTSFSFATSQGKVAKEILDNLPEEITEDNFNQVISKII